MRILHLNQFRSHQGGVEGYIADVARALDRRGHSSHLISFTPDDPSELVTDSTYVPLPDWPVSPDQAADAIEVVIRQFKPDVAYIHAVYHPSLIAWLARRLPSVAYIHAPYPVCPGSAQYLRKSAKVCQQSAGVICLINAQREKCCWGRHPVKHLRLLQRTRQFTQTHLKVRRIIVGSEFMRRLMVRGGTPADKIIRLAPVLIDPRQITDKGISDSATVLYVGRLTAEKGITHLIQALASIPGRWRLLVAGEGPERGHSEALARQLGVADRIEFLGWLDNHEMARRYQQSTVVGFPSLWPEPFGRVGPEAYIHGKPVVAYATGGIPDWLIDGATGHLVTPGDITQLGQQLRHLLESPEICQRMGERAQRMAQEQWSSNSHVDQLLQIFGATLEHED